MKFSGIEIGSDAAKRSKAPKMANDINEFDRALHPLVV